VTQGLLHFTQPPARPLRVARSDVRLMPETVSPPAKAERLLTLHSSRRRASPSHSNESRADGAMVGFVLGRYAGPTTFNEARRGRLGGQSCRRNSAVVGHVLTEAITVSCHRVSRSNCDAVTNRPVAHPLLGPCHTLSDTVIATRATVVQLFGRS
jgi:hypothetical protein